jgi:hypothetical protein
MNLGIRIIAVGLSHTEVTGKIHEYRIGTRALWLTVIPPTLNISLRPSPNSFNNIHLHFLLTIHHAEMALMVQK